MPSKLGNLLGVKTTALQQVIYFQRYIVTDPGDSGLPGASCSPKKSSARRASSTAATFKAEMGAEAIRDLLRGINLKELAETLRQQLKDIQVQAEDRDADQAPAHH